MSFDTTFTTTKVEYMLDLFFFYQKQHVFILLNGNYKEGWLILSTRTIAGQKVETLTKKYMLESKMKMSKLTLIYTHLPKTKTSNLVQVEFKQTIFLFEKGVSINWFFSVRQAM